MTIEVIFLIAVGAFLINILAHAAFVIHTEQPIRERWNSGIYGKVDVLATIAILFVLIRVVFPIVVRIKPTVATAKERARPYLRFIKQGVRNDAD